MTAAAAPVEAGERRTPSYAAAQTAAQAATRARVGTRAWAPPLVAALVVLVVGLAIVDTLPVGVFFDDGMYVVLAKSLATGHGYRWLQLPGTPVATHFPPGYPAVLALLWKLYPRFPANIVLFKIANACFLAIAAAGLTFFAERRLELPRWRAAALATIATASIPALVLSTQVMSEPLFLALLLPTLLFAERVVEDSERSRRASTLIALAVAAGVVTLVRTNGIAIAAGVGLLLLARRRVRDAVIFGATTIAVLAPWQLWVRAHRDAVPPVLGGNYEPYTTWLMNGFHQLGPSLVWRTVASTSLEVAYTFGIIFSPLVEHGAQLAMMIAALALAAVGVRRLWRQAPATCAFLGVYLAIVVLWPFTPARFVYAIWPILLLCVVLGMLEVWRWRPAATPLRAVRWLALACAVAAIAGDARYTTRGARRRYWSSVARANAAAARPLIQWTRRYTTPNQVVASNIESMIYLYADRQALPTAHFIVRDYFRPQTAAESADAMRATLSAFHADVVAVIAADSTRAGMQLMAVGPSPELTLVDSLPNGLVYVPTRP